MPSSSNPLIYLASASPRRSALLTQIGVAHHVRPVDIDESIHRQETPADYVIRLARTKAETLWKQLVAAERLPVLGSDTTVALGNDILGKPANRAEGVAMLRRLSGQTHQVCTGVALRSSHGIESRLSVSEVRFRALNDAEMEAYWLTGEPADKAGGYAVQGRAAVFIERIGGSYSGIVGLPLFETAALLVSIGWNVSGAATVGRESLQGVGGAAR
jgi:septum formation protein